MRILTISDFDIAVNIFTEYQKGINFPAPFVDMLRTAMKAGSIKVGLTENSESVPNGFGVIGQASGQIHAIWVDDTNSELDDSSIRKFESEILEWCFTEIKNPPERIDFPKMTDNLRNNILRRGYVEYKRVGMSATREDLLKNRKISLLDGFALVPYQPDKKEKVADVIAKANKNHVDAIIYPEYFSSKEKAFEFLEQLERNQLGLFLEGVSQLLVKEEQIIGFCMIVKKENDASIPDIGIIPDYQGQGLGKALLVNTVLDLLHFDESVQTINLAVTLSNPARFLYEKSGFQITDEFSAIIYSGDIEKAN